jgi:hypothetical protein
MLAADIAPAAEMMRRGEWGDRTPFLAWAIDAPACHPMIRGETLNRRPESVWGQLTGSLG